MDISYSPPHMLRRTGENRYAQDVWMEQGARRQFPLLPQCISSPLVFFPPSSSGGRKKWEHTHDATPPFLPSSLPPPFASGILNSSSLPPLVSLLPSFFSSSIPFFRRKSFSRNFSSLLQCGEKGGGEERGKGKGEGFAKTFRSQRPLESFCHRRWAKPQKQKKGEALLRTKGKLFQKRPD